MHQWLTPLGDGLEVQGEPKNVTVFRIAITRRKFYNYGAHNSVPVLHCFCCLIVYQGTFAVRNADERYGREK